MCLTVKAVVPLHHQPESISIACDYESGLKGRADVGGKMDECVVI